MDTRNTACFHSVTNRAFVKCQYQRSSTSPVEGLWLARSNCFCFVETYGQKVVMLLWYL